MNIAPIISFNQVLNREPLPLPVNDIDAIAAGEITCNKVIVAALTKYVIFILIMINKFVIVKINLTSQ